MRNPLLGPSTRLHGLETALVLVSRLIAEVVKIILCYGRRALHRTSVECGQMGFAI